MGERYQELGRLMLGQWKGGWEGGGGSSSVEDESGGSLTCGTHTGPVCREADETTGVSSGRMLTPSKPALALYAKQKQTG
ncbi:hypothetical protein BaRGS_00010854 [Batillaria attramentaria]|uniref:Uncharacterized protein n=1 Tax=Batillaria attramentaria TaxID=370345 RepID=A0ABD0LFF3_9CAEN